MTSELRLTVRWCLDVLVVVVWFEVDDLYLGKSALYVRWSNIILLGLANLSVPRFLKR